MSGVHYEDYGTCGICGRETVNGSCLCHTFTGRKALSLEAPPEGTCCNWCGAVVEVENFCGACYEAGRRFL